MVTRRTVLSGVLGGAALIPALLWLSPALFSRRAPSFRDQADFFFPVKLYTADRIARGQLPLWNPLSGLGEPWLASGQSGVFYPPTLFFLLPLPALAAGLFLLLHFAIGVSGAWRFLKNEAVSDAGALLGAAAYGACGFAASLSAYWNHFGAWAYLPWIALLARSGLRSRVSMLPLAAAVALQALAGSPEISAATLCVAALFAWESRHEQSGWLEPPRGKRLLRLAGAAGLGLALAGVTLVPMSELLLRSQRRVPLPRPEREWGSVGLPGFSSALGFSLESSGNGYLSSLYVGPLLLCAAAGAFAEEQRRRLALLLGGVAAAGILVSMAAPPGPWLRSLPPLDRIRYPAKALAWTFFALPMLAGIGADSLRFAPGRRRAPVMAAIALGGALLLLFSRQPPIARLAEGIGLAALALLAVARAGETSVAGRVSRARGAVLEVIAALALAASLFVAGRLAFRFAPESEIRRVPDSIPFLARVAGRVLTPPPLELASWVLRGARFDAGTLRRQREALLGYTNLLSGVATIRTASALPTGAQQRIAASIDAGDPVRAAGAAGGRVLWSPFSPANMGLREVGEFSRAPLNPYRPRLSFVSGYRIETDPARAWDRAARRELDWSREVFLGREPDPRPAPGGKGSFVIARIAEDLPERVAADINSGTAGILVLADLDYPGWKASVDGRPAPILSADGYLRAVALPAGSHRVVFRYRPVSFYAGAALSLLALGTLFVILYRG
ncbi:MAG TPA: YfhO family protein [Thermoanaerobaculia bacterium]|nr:YfhO family protein [Thermoanaerobaculia bacterium]